MKAPKGCCLLKEIPPPAGVIILPRGAGVPLKPEEQYLIVVEDGTINQLPPGSRVFAATGAAFTFEGTNYISVPENSIMAWLPA